VKLEEAIDHAMTKAKGRGQKAKDQEQLAFWLKELGERRRTMSWVKQTQQKAVLCVVIRSNGGDTHREWHAFAALPRVGDALRGLGKVKEVYWMLNLEGGDGQPGPPDKDKTHYPILYCDESIP
jgi:hypothetical protein